MSGKPRVPQISAERMKILKKLSQEVREEVVRRYGTELTYEQRRDASHKVMTEVLWTDEEDDLGKLKTDAKEIEIGDKRYRRLEQASSATYYGRWGAHYVRESLYRQVGVQNGPTVKPLELRAGMISQHMSPDLARITGELSGLMNSREMETTLKAVGMVPPSRSFLENRVGAMTRDMGSQIECLEAQARDNAAPPADIASISCGLDRMAVRMIEPAHSETATRPHRKTAYQRTPPPPRDYTWRMGWVGSTTAYDKTGNPLHTWRCCVEPGADSDEVAHRVAADVRWLNHIFPKTPIHCIQDAAPELQALPMLLHKTLPKLTPMTELIDFEHVMGYLDNVVDACEPSGDPKNRKAHYRSELLRDDDAIDRIWSGLLRCARHLPKQGEKRQRHAVAAALSYIRNRKPKMRYASFYQKNLPIGSGATEGTVGLMQQRIKRRGQSWDMPGLRNITTARGLVLSGRWLAVWSSFAADHRQPVHVIH